MPAFAGMLNNAMFNFRKVIKADFKALLHKIWQVILHRKGSCQASVSLGERNCSVDQLGGNEWLRNVHFVSSGQRALSVVDSSIGR